MTDPKAALREIISQCHNLPHTATAARIATLAGELLASPSLSPAVRDVTLREALRKITHEHLQFATYFEPEDWDAQKEARAALGEPISPLSPPEGGKP